MYMTDFIQAAAGAIISGLELALLIRVLLSWIPHNHYQPVIQILYQITDPILKPFQNLIPANRFGIDFSPILAFLALGVIRQIIFRLF